MKNILFIGTSHMDIYKDIVLEMKRMGYAVDFIKERVLMEDPDNLRGYKGIKKLMFVNPEKFNKKNKTYWEKLLAEPEYSKTYDILFVLDGCGIHPVIFDILRRRNNNLFAVNYLFDTTKYVYRFDKNFALFDNIASFDVADCKQHNIKFLPIFYNEIEEKSNTEFLFFGLGRYDATRYSLFSKMAEISSRRNRKSFLKVHLDYVSHLRLNHFIKNLIGINHFPTEVYSSNIATYRAISPADFRAIIAKSEIIIDTSPQLQDGLTARFMWALGAGRKIITTNTYVRQYPFYTPNQIFIVEDIDALDNDKNIDKFIDSELKLTDDTISIIKEYRTDNWLKKLLEEHLCLDYHI